MLRDAYGRTLTQEELKGGAAAMGIPTCSKSAAAPTTEERQLSPNLKKIATEKPETGNPELEDPFAEDPSLAATTPAGRQILARKGFTNHLPQLSAALAAATSLAAARKIVRSRGQALWAAASAQTKSASPDTDDRTSHWTRLEGTRLIRQWSPAFALTARIGRN